MLAEIFILRLEAVVRMAAKEAAANSRFVPITLPAAKAEQAIGLHSSGRDKNLPSREGS